MSDKKLPLMRKAIAIWLIENTSLTFHQISDFCGFHELEIQAIADGDVAYNAAAQNPISCNQLTQEEITRCEKDADESLILKEDAYASLESKFKKKVTKYTPIARRNDKPDGIYFLLKKYPNISNRQIKKLIGTTDKMIDSIRNRTYWNIRNIKAKDVILLGLCKQLQLNEVINELKSSKNDT